MEEQRVIFNRLKKLERWQSIAKTQEGGTPIGPSRLAAGYVYAGQVANPPTRASIDAAFQAAFGRSPSGGDLITLRDSANYIYVLVYEPINTGWIGTRYDYASTAGATVKF